jgi:hypothetical protein
MNHKPIKIKVDRRFKNGNIKTTGNELRGNPETMELKRMDVPPGAPIEMQLNPPIIVSRELGVKLAATDKKGEQP